MIMLKIPHGNSLQNREKIRRNKMAALNDRNFGFFFSFLFFRAWIFKKRTIKHGRLFCWSQRILNDFVLVVFDFHVLLMRSIRCTGNYKDKGCISQTKIKILKSHNTILLPTYLPSFELWYKCTLTSNTSACPPTIWYHEFEICTWICAAVFSKATAEDLTFHIMTT